MRITKVTARIAVKQPTVQFGNIEFELLYEAEIEEADNVDDVVALLFADAKMKIKEQFDELQAKKIKVSRRILDNLPSDVATKIRPILDNYEIIEKLRGGINAD